MYNIPTGSTLLDLVVGAGQIEGYKNGRIINVVGDKSSGKTFLCIETIAAAKKLYADKLKWNYDDGETGFSFDTKKLYGFDIIDENTRLSTTVEQSFYNINKFLDSLKDDELGIYVIDSLDALQDKAGQDRSEDRIKKADKGQTLDSGSYNMSKQKFLSQEFFPNITSRIEQSNCLLIIISQVRDNIGVMFGSKYKRSGGKALDFYAHTVLWLSEIEKIKVANRIKAITVKAKTTKSKTCRPFRECFINIIFDYGLDDLGSNIDFLFDLLTDLGKQKGKRINIEYKEQTFKTKESLIQYIEDNNLEEEIRQATVNKWESIENKVKSKRKSRFDEKK